MTSLSNLRLTLSDHVGLSLWVVFPYDEPSAAFEAYIHKLSDIAPFKLSDKHWKQWFYSKSGSLYARKLNVQIATRSD